MEDLVKVIIAEDEDIIRDGLMNTIPWEELGFLLVGGAANGLEALDLHKINHAQLIITDIKMPFLNGIELLEKLRQIDKNVLVIIVSGYDEFNFAQKAIKLGAYDYVLKPIDLDEFTLLLTNTRNFILEQIQETKRIENFKQKIKQDELLSIIRGETVLADIQNNDHYCCLILSTKTGVVEDSLDYLQLAEADATFEYELTSIFKSSTHDIVKTKALERVILLSAKTPSEIFVTRDLLQQNILSVKDIRFAVSTVKPYNEINNCYKEAVATNGNHFVVGQQKVFYYDKLSDDTSAADSFVNIDITDLNSIISSGDKERISNYFDTINKDIIQNGVKSFIQMLMVVSNIYYKLMQLLQSNVGEHANDYIPSELRYSKIIEKTTYEEMLQALLNTALTVSDVLKTSNTTKFSSVFLDATRYIEDHYTDSMLSLKKVSKDVGIGTCYLSAIFKQNTGKTFIEFLTALRMEKAMELLTTTPMLIYEISESVGYQNSTYFSTIFKKYFGKAPKDIR